MGRYMIFGMCVIGMCIASPAGCSMLGRVDATLERLGAANDHLTTANAQLGMANHQLAEMQSQLTEANRQLVAANKRLDATQENVTAANRKIDKTNEGLAQTLAQLGETNKVLSQTNEKLNVIDQVIQKFPLLSPRPSGRGPAPRRALTPIGAFRRGRQARMDLGQRPFSRVPSELVNRAGLTAGRSHAGPSLQM